MEKNTIRFNGEEVETYQENTKVKIISLLGRKVKMSYFENPPVAAIVNGELSSLNATIPENAEISTVNLFSSLGRRVYRKTLCFLLCHASSILFPERTLVIAHSLGDGYYFSYRDKEKVEKEKLKNLMKELIQENITLDVVRLSSKEALSYIKRNNLIETEKLLNTRNDGSYVFTKLGDSLELYYEPMLPTTALLEVWDLIEYGDGLLLRYPQSRNDSSIMPFTDNHLLFSVFKENKKYGSILGLESLGALNERQIKGDIEETIILSETLQRKRFSVLGEEIAKKRSKIVLLSGPSSSGKTTSSLKLCNELKLNGLNPIKISLDDYYKDYSDIPLDSTGEKDFEVIESLDLKTLEEEIKALLDKKEVFLTTYSIKTRERKKTEKGIIMGNNDVLVIEGIHALNPNLLPFIKSQDTYKIYVSALTSLNLDSRSRISTTDNRILRRLVRDNRTRALDAIETLTRWPSVEKGEKNNIFPYQNNADMMINSALEYELGVLAPYATPLLRSVPKEAGAAYLSARRLLSFLDLVYPIPSDKVPLDSVLREFIGGSLYDVS